jgi:hypothetical protein
MKESDMITAWTSDGKSTTKIERPTKPGRLAEEVIEKAPCSLASK